MSAVISHELAPQVKLSTAGEFLDWLKPGKHADLIDGETFMHSPINLRHARLLNFLDHLLRSYLDGRALGELFREVVAVKLDGRNVFLPDLSFFTTEQTTRLGPVFATEAPALIVEALSPWSAERDTGMKFATYEQAGVREYWVLDPETLAHRFFRLAEETYAEFGAGEEVVRSEVMAGFWLRRAWLDPTALPEVAPCLAEITTGS